MAEGPVAAKIQQLTERYTQISLKPAETPDVQVKMMKPDELRRMVNNSSFIWRLADPCKCRIEGEGIQDGELGKKATFTLQCSFKVLLNRYHLSAS